MRRVLAVCVVLAAIPASALAATSPPVGQYGPRGQSTGRVGYLHRPWAKVFVDRDSKVGVAVTCGLKATANPRGFAPLINGRFVFDGETRVSFADGFRFHAHVEHITVSGRYSDGRFVGRFTIPHSGCANSLYVATRTRRG